VKATCTCGAVFEFGSTKETINPEICSNCHPFYTGQEKVLDTAGRVEKFQKKREQAKAALAKKEKAEKAKSIKKTTKAKPKTTAKKTSTKVTTKASAKK